MRQSVVVMAVESQGAVKVFVNGDSWGSFSSWASLLTWDKDRRRRPVDLNLTDAFIIRVIEGVR